MSAITKADRPASVSVEAWRRMDRLHRIRAIVFERDGFACRLCGHPHGDQFNRLELDHVIPKSKGGATTVANCQTLCGKCNGRKGARVRPNGPVGWDAHLIPVVWVSA